MKRISRLLAAVFLPALVAGAAVPTPARSEAPPSVESFSPDGDTPKIRQATARFTAPMVPFGDPRLDDPFEVSCSEGIAGKGRWADGRNWAYDFESDLPGGVVCTFTLKPSLRSLDGRPVEGRGKFSFSTGGPAILQSHPHEGTRWIDENQAFLLLLNAEATEESILENVSFSAEGVNESIGATIVKGEDRKALIESGPARGLVHLLHSVYGRRTTLEFRRKEKAWEDPRIVVLMARRTFPPGSDVFLRWGKGIRTTGGIATGKTQSLAFRTRPPFTVEFHCDRERNGADCIPLLPMTLRFSAPVSRTFAGKIVLRGKGGASWKPSLPEESGEGESFVHGVAFPGPFPEKSKFRVEIPADIRDESGRAPANRDRYPLDAATDGYPALAKFPTPFGIVELNGDATFPLTVRNIEAQARTRMLEIGERKPGAADDVKEEALEKAIALGEAVKDAVPESLKKTGNRDIARMKGKLLEIRMGREGRIVEWIRKVSRKHWTRDHRDVPLLSADSDAREFDIPRPGGEKAFEVVGIPFRKPGFHVVEIGSENLGFTYLGGGPMYVSAAVLVTNLSAHFKRGRESSLVWVTTLDKGEPVPDADVVIRNTATGRIAWQGRTDSRGVAAVRQTLPDVHDSPTYDIDSGYFVSARKGDDFTFVLPTWNRGIEPHRFQLPTEYGYDPVIATTVFDRTLFRAGETVRMKHFLRRHSLDGLFQVPVERLPKALLVRHAGSEQRYEMPISFTPDGSAESEWTIPKEAKLGEYAVSLLDRAPGKKGTRTAVGGYEEGDEEYGFSDRGERRTGSIRVEEFRVPLMKGSVHAPGGPKRNVEEVEVDLLLSYLSGGGAGGAPVRLRTLLQPKWIGFDDYGEYLFANGRVVEGVFRNAPSNIAAEEGEEGGGEDGEAGAAEASAPGGKPRVRTRDLVLDASGALRTKVAGLGRSATPRDLVAEFEYLDPNGETQTVSARVPLWPSGVLLGIKPDSWAASKEKFKFHVAALDLSGTPLKEVRVAVDLYRRKAYSHRKRLLGGMYAYEHVMEVRKLQEGICEGTTDDKGLLACETKSPVSGNVILQARASDADGNESVANSDVWVAGKEEWWFDVSDTDRIDLLPERKRYEPGETAVFQVRMPFREATALVSVEREGVAEVFVQKLSGKNPVVSVPVKPYHAPNVYVSVLLVRGRVTDVAPTATVDLGRPAYKLGIAEIHVGWKAHEIQVEVAPERAVYRTREKAKVAIRAKRAGGGPLPKESEVIVAAVDEGLLELSPNGSWKLLDAMMGRRPYEVETATAQMQVVGKRHYGRKALPQGGGGGRQPAREFFETLLFWKARVPLDEKGEARVEIPLNDSLTSFRIVAVASGGAEFFGTGDASIRTTREVMILSGLPPLVREEDRFRAGFTVRNTTDKPMEVRAEAGFDAGTGSGRESLAPLSFPLEPGQAREAAWDVRVPAGAESLRWEASVIAGEVAADRLLARQRVVPAVPVRTFQATLAQLAAPIGMKVRLPSEALPGRGGIDVALRSRLTEGMGGVTRYMREYPYVCLEQTVSRAVALRDPGLWKRVMAELPSFLDADGLAKYFPLMSEGSDALTAYILAVANEAGWEIPGDPKERMIGGLAGFLEGRVVRYGSLPTADLSLRKMAAMEALSRHGKAAASHLGSIDVDPGLWPTSGVIDWLNVLRRVEGIPQRERRISEAERILRARMNFQGTTMGFSTERTDFLWWLMVSGDVNAVRAILALVDRPDWKEDIPRMVRGAVGRQHAGAWNTTVANAWGVLAMEKFSRIFESEPVGGSTTVGLERDTRSVDWSKAPKGGSVFLPWPKGEGTLDVAHKGTGRPWTTVSSLAAVPLKEPFSSGYKVKKTLSPVQRKAAGRWSRGDVVRVSLEIDAQSDMTWVVVNDPIPGGGSILGTGLGRDSELLRRREKRKGLAWPAFTERAFDGYRAYYEFVPKGKWTVEYTVRLNNGGSFRLPPTRVEALYAPEMFGEIPNPAVDVAP